MEKQIVVTNPEDIQKIVKDAVAKAITEIKPPNNHSREVFSNKDAIKYLGVSRSTLQRWREDGILPYRKVNGTILYTKADLLEMLEENKG